MYVAWSSGGNLSDKRSANQVINPTANETESKRSSPHPPGQELPPPSPPAPPSDPGSALAAAAAAAAAAAEEAEDAAAPAAAAAGQPSWWTMLGDPLPRPLSEGIPALPPLPLEPSLGGDSGENILAIG